MIYLRKPLEIKQKEGQPICAFGYYGHLGPVIAVDERFILTAEFEVTNFDELKAIADEFNERFMGNQSLRRVDATR